MFDESQGKYSGKEGFSSKKHEVIMRFDECNTQICALLEQKSGDLGHGQVRDQKLMAEIADLEREPPKVSVYNKEEDEMKGFDLSLSFSVDRNRRTDGCLDGGAEGFFRCFRSIDV